MKYTCSIVENEPLARRLLETYISKTDNLELTWRCQHYSQVPELISSLPTDIVFMDLQDADIGPDTELHLILVKYAKKIIITTAYPKAILNSIPDNIGGYLNKPITYEKFMNAVKEMTGDATYK
jgi:two-component system, LytTR family, response regulator